MRTTDSTHNCVSGNSGFSQKHNGIETENELIEDEMINRHMREQIMGYSLETCCSCGCEIRSGQRIAKVYSTGDIIHEECWSNYAEDNFSELCCISDLDDDGTPYGFFEEE